MPDNIRVSEVIPARPDRIFEAWLDSETHSAFTGAKASIEGVGGSYSAWDGYIQGTTFEAEPHHRIVQSWRTTEFPDEAPPSRLEVLLEEDSDGTRVTLIHTELPEGMGAQYEAGWKEHYFTPMKIYFGSSDAITHADSPVAAVAPKKKPAKKRPVKRRPAKAVAPKRKASSARSAKKKPAKRKVSTRNKPAARRKRR